MSLSHFDAAVGIGGLRAFGSGIPLVVFGYPDDRSNGIGKDAVGALHSS